MMSVDQPMKAHVINQSLNESFEISHYVIPPVNHHQLTDLIYNDNCEWPIKGQMQTASLAPRIFEMQK